MRSGDSYTNLTFRQFEEFLKISAKTRSFGSNAGISLMPTDVTDECITRIHEAAFPQPAQLTARFVKV